jgi:hypothetical protein
MGWDDREMTDYIADLLARFTNLDRLYDLRDEQGNALQDLDTMIYASDPVYGSASSFETERRIRAHIGDYSLFHAGMYPELYCLSDNEDGQRYLKMVQIGKDSYHIVSQFNVFEYAASAPLFKRLAENFEACIRGLSSVRKELERLSDHPALPSQAIFI